MNETIKELKQRRSRAVAVATACVAAVALATTAVADDTTASATTGDAAETNRGSAQRDTTANEQREASDTAQRQGRTPPQQGRGMASSQLLDVEELNDNVANYVGQKVSVAGEIEHRLDTRSFVIESGGIFDDEITVVVPRDAKGISAVDLVEDADIVVSGTVRSAALIDIERELGWDLDPHLEMEFEGTRTYLVADRITRQSK